ncbi:MAG: divalent-cation tolerance protein CutA [Planctomycetota bacterium]|jgi:periplasmic divalent cation tolerance protein|nr:divalent-cation tolerance protein CutA [Planctomycetota bacterium]
MDQIRVVFTTVPDAAVGSEIAKRVVEEDLAACVNIVPGLRSVFKWDGKVSDDPEALLIAKVRADKLTDYEARLSELHPYDVPEILALQPDHVSEAYLSWVMGS